MHKSKYSWSLPSNNPPSKLNGTNNHKLDGNKFLATDYTTFETHQLLHDSQHFSLAQSTFPPFFTCQSSISCARRAHTCLAA